MKIGFTYDMKEEYLARGFSSAQTADMDSRESVEKIAAGLETIGYEVDRIGHLQALVDRLAKDERWDFVFNIAEGTGSVSREAQIPALLEAYGIPFVFGSAWTMLVTQDKALAKTVLAQAGVRTAPWRTVTRETDLDNVDMPYPLFVKPVGEGSSMGVDERSLVRDRATLESTCRALWAAYNQPVLVEPFLSGTEFTVGLLGTGADARVVGVMERHLDRLNQNFARSFANKAIDHERPDYYSLCQDERGAEAGRLALQSWAAVQGRDAGRVDIRCDANNTPYVLEIGALAGLVPGYSDLCILADLAGLNYTELLEAILGEFFKRMPSLDQKAAYAAE